MNFDTNILIAYINGEPKVVNFILDLKTANQPVFISNIVEAEMLSLRSLTQREIDLIKDFTSQNFIIINADRNITLMSAEIRRKYLKLKLPDAIILATSIVNGYPLCTRDSFEKERIKEIKIINI